MQSPGRKEAKGAQVEVRLDSAVSVPKVIILTDQMTEEVNSKMTVIHFLICSAATFPIAYLMRWMEHTANGVLKYFGIFLAIYIAIWISQYARLKKNISALNKKVNNLA